MGEGGIGSVSFGVTVGEYLGEGGIGAYVQAVGGELPSYPYVGISVIFSVPVFVYAKKRVRAKVAYFILICRKNGNRYR